VAARLIEPFIPETSQKIVQQVGVDKVTEKPEILFQRFDIDEVLQKAEGLYPSVEPTEADKGAGESDEYIDVPAKEEITFEEFSTMQLQVGEVISCEEVKKSKKLLCSQVKIGGQVKQIVSGIKGFYTPEEMVGKKVMVIVNLKPVKLAGILSEGMLLCADGKDGEPILMVPEKDVPSGAVVS
jgi:methionyl-tRNA synthetase